MTTGIALLPGKAEAMSLVRFRAMHDDVIGGPAIGMDRFPPHVSILQAPMPETALGEGLLERIRMIAVPDARDRLTMDGVNYQPTGWIFLDLVCERWLSVLQQRTLETVTSLIETDGIDRNKDMTGYTVAERASYLRYGYRYTGDAFQPHVTLGRIEPSERHVAAELDRQFRNEIGLWQSSPEGLMSYVAGPFGVVDRVIAAVAW